MSCNRVTESEVFDLIPETTLTSLKTQIMCANALVNNLADSECGSSLSDTELQCIEAYLSAHFAAQSDATLMITSEKVEGSTTVVSRGNTASESGVMSSSFGQSANTMSNGCLQELELMKTSFFTV